MKKVLLDTDIGSDIDDAVCLAYLLAQPECDLLGITTVSGEPVQRARIADAICRNMGRDIPIYPGVENPLLVAPQQPLAPQAAKLGAWPHRQAFPTGEAIEFLRQTIRAHPHEVTLLTIGPLTNIALLFALDPEIPGLLKEHVLMCGVFTPDRPTSPILTEWNAKLDPHATAMVYRTALPAHRSFGLDVTTHVTMPAAEVRRRFNIQPLRPVLDFAEVWFKTRDSITFHDPLAAVGIFDSAVCTYEPGQVTGELEAKDRLGQTKFQPAPTGGHQIALTVDADRFFDDYFGVFAQTGG